jgi:hypothetical protein
MKGGAMVLNRSLEANIVAAKAAVHQMIKQWDFWRNTRDDQKKLSYIGAYAAAYTSCKVYLENYLKHLYPNEKKMPPKIAQDIRNIVNDMERIEKVSGEMLQKAIRDIDQLKRDSSLAA